MEIVLVSVFELKKMMLLTAAVNVLPLFPVSNSAIFPSQMQKSRNVFLKVANILGFSSLSDFQPFQQPFLFPFWKALIKWVSFTKPSHKLSCNSTVFEVAETGERKLVFGSSQPFFLLSCNPNLH